VHYLLRTNVCVPSSFHYGVHDWQKGRKVNEHQILKKAKYENAATANWPDLRSALL
jgi:hypothetical protein